MAFGMEIWMYEWVKCSNGAGQSINVSGSTIDTGYGEIKCIASSNCKVTFTGDWVPKAKVRLNLMDADGTVSARCSMQGSCNTLPACNPHARGNFERTSGSASTGGWEIGGVTVPVSSYSGEGAATYTISDTKNDLQVVGECKALWTGTVEGDASAWTNILPPDYYAEAQGWVWDSWAGLDLHGACSPKPGLPCAGGFGLIMYGWWGS
jgi:hypothetical protein